MLNEITTWPEFWAAFHVLWSRQRYDKDTDKPIWRAMQLFLERIERADRLNDPRRINA